PALCAPTTYYVAATSASGCVSAASPVTATINANPAAPTTTGASRCGSGTVTLTASGSGGTLKWYSDAGLNTQVATGGSFTTPVLNAPTTYYVTETSAAGCVSAASPVTATINAFPTTPSTTGASRCGSGTVTLTASGCTGGTLKGSNVSINGQQVATGGNFTTPALSATTTYYVSCTSAAGCEG